MIGIERRAKWDLFLFTLIHAERYASLEDYHSSKPVFRQHVRLLLPEGWEVGEDNGIWCKVQPPNDRTPNVGFKIHLSTTPEKAKDLLSAIVPPLVDEEVAFKLLVDERILELNNSNIRGSESCGKFVTAYPVDVAQLERLMGRLYEATRGFDGIYILSDKRYKDSKVLFYRYGSFRNYYQVNIYGELEPLYRAPDGQLVRDIRSPYFELPEGIEDPFPDEDTDDDEEGDPVLKGRYEISEVLASSAKGGVYRGIDRETGAPVVLKEARPLVNRSHRTPYDAVDALTNEHRILQLLADTGLTPRPLDFFQEWEHTFLVMELVEGIRLISYRAFESFSLFLMTGLERDDIRRYCEEFLVVARGLVAGVRAIHEQGVVIQDLAPQNVLFNLEDKKLTFIDFESAYTERDGKPSPIIPLRTLGYGGHREEDMKPTRAGDYAALGSLLGDLLYPVTPFFAVAPQKRATLLQHAAREKGIPGALIRLMLEAGEHPEEIDAMLDDAERSMEDISPPGPLPPSRDDGELRTILADIEGYIVDCIEHGDDPLDLPTDYRRFVSNPLSVAYGASGIAAFLKRVRGDVPAPLLDGLCTAAAKIGNERYAPGLYMGTSGVAWTLLELEKRQQAESLMDIAAQAPLLFENADMFYGAAGWGLTNLFFFDRLGDEKYLRRAVDAFENIKPMLQEEDTGYSYINMGDVCHGLAHGASGIGYFLLRLHQVTGQEEHLTYARGLLGFEIASAEDRGGHVVFRRAASEPVNTPYWRIGSAGIGAIALRFHAVLGDDEYLSMAHKIANYLEGKYAVFPTNFTGMVGLGSFFMDMHLRTGEARFREEARRFVDRIMLFALKRPAGIVFPGEEFIRISTDYGTGSAGTGVFLHRLLTGSGVPFLDF